MKNQITTKNTPFSCLSILLNINYNVNYSVNFPKVRDQEPEKHEYSPQKSSYDYKKNIEVPAFGNFHVVSVLYRGLANIICLCEWIIDKRKTLVLSKYVTYVNDNIFDGCIQIEKCEDGQNEKEQIINYYSQFQKAEKKNERKINFEKRKTNSLLIDSTLDYKYNNPTEKKVTKLDNSENIKKYKVALKLKHKNCRYTECEINQLRAEIDIHKTLQHSNILQMLLCGEDENDIWIFFEYSFIGNLYSYIGYQFLREEEVKKIVSQVVYALYYLHMSGIIHCDIKLENILLFPPEKLTCDHFVNMENLGIKNVVPNSKNVQLNIQKLFSSRNEELIMKTANEIENIEYSTVSRNTGTLKTKNYFNYCIKLCDLGLSVRCDFDKHHPNRGVKGSYGFIAPEIFKECDFNHKIDMWSLGISTFILLSGYAPFDPYFKYKEQLSFDERYWSKISSDAKNFIQSLLEVNPLKRFSVLEALHHPWIRDYFLKA